MKKFKLNIKAAEEVGKEINKINSETNKILDEVKSQCNHIYGNIYLSSYKKAQDETYLKNNDFTHIVNCAQSSKSFTPIYLDSIQYLNLDLKDEPGYDLFSVIFKFIEFIESNVSNDKSEKRVLVHCYEGVSRGPALITSYLMWKNKWSFDTAYEFVKSKRQCVDINIGFCSQLNKWNNQLSLEKNEKLYQIDDKGNVRILSKNEVEADEMLKSTAILFYRDGIIQKLTLRQGQLNDDKYNVIVELIKSYEKCEGVSRFVDFDINKLNRVKLGDMINCCF